MKAMTVEERQARMEIEMEDIKRQQTHERAARGQPPLDVIDEEMGRPQQVDGAQTPNSDIQSADEHSGSGNFGGDFRAQMKFNDDEDEDDSAQITDSRDGNAS